MTNFEKYGGLFFIFVIKTLCEFPVQSKSTAQSSYICVKTLHYALRALHSFPIPMLFDRYSYFKRNCWRV